MGFKYSFLQVDIFVNSKHKCFHISFYQTEQLEGLLMLVLEMKNGVTRLNVFCIYCLHKPISSSCSVLTETALYIFYVSVRS